MEEKEVISMYKWHQIKAMRAEGKPIKAIARDPKISSNTVSRYLRSLEAPRYKEREIEKLTDTYVEGRAL